MPEKKPPTLPPPAARAAQPEEKAGMFSLLGTASTMGLHMVSGPIVGGALGWLVDGWLDSWPIGAGIGLLLGVAAGFRNVWADARFLIREQDKADPGAPDGTSPASFPGPRTERNGGCAPGPEASPRHEGAEVRQAEGDPGRRPGDTGGKA